MNIKSVFVLISLGISAILKAGEGKNTVSADLVTVTVYRNGAELVHTANVDIRQGNNDFIIEGVSNAVDINSIRINCPATVTIMSVEFSNNYLSSSEISPRIRFLMDSVDQLQKEADKIMVAITTTSDLLEVLKANREIKGSQTGLSVAELVKLMDYYKNKSIELQNELAAQRDRQKKVAAQIVKLKNQVSEEEKKNAKTSGRIQLQVSSAIAGKAAFTISYITPNAYWSPFYDIRVDDIKSPLKIIYKAKVVQTTGIDWKKVKLSLSTSVPNQWGNAPVLKSWFLGYVNPVAIMERSLGQNRIQSFQKELSGKVAGVEAKPVGAGNDINIRGYDALRDSKPLYIVNGTVMSEQEFSKINPQAIQKTEVLADAQATAIYGSRAGSGAILITLKDGLDDYISVTDNELNVTFDIDLPYDIPANGKEQTATLREYAVEALYKFYSVPKLDKDAYLLAEIPDWEKLNLLPGDANIIFENTYVGKSFIDPNSTFDTLNLTLGHDKRVVIKREKLTDYSSVKFLGNNKLQKITYELTVKNNKKDTVKLLLKDQIPLSTNKEIEVELVDNGDASVNTDIGVLTWKIELAPGESKKFRFVYSVKYPKEKMLNLN